ncbi:MAG: TIGR02147 family protein [Pseudobdellovibrionaceae bacterium]
MAELKRLYEYENYRDFLKDFYVHSKANDKKFSFRYFSRIAGFQSSSFLKQVMDGQRNLSEQGIEKFAKALKLNKDESLFFKNLVLLNQATIVDERHFYSREILRSRTFKKLNPIKESQLKYLSEWYFIPLREMVTLPYFREDPEWISKQLRPSISAEEVQKALDELLSIGLLLRDAQGRLIQGSKDIFVADQITSAFLAHGHREMIKKASESIDLIPSARREISAITINLSAESFKKIKEIIHNFRNDIRAEAAREEKPDAVYQVTLQVFPLVETYVEPQGEPKGDSK